MPFIDNWKNKVRKLKIELTALRIAASDPRVPVLVKALVVFTVAYALSPIDLIPDFIPVLGYLDDLILLPLLIWVILKLIPESLMHEFRKKAMAQTEQPRSKNWIAGAVIILIWILLGGWLIRKFWYILK
ncbi:MAG: DUF1232 domain-containing protein [Hymenobacteraceae bacterium]|nr:DUF1232 domain-containing protein [Hymenobacteraceae bacterium]MDX5394609.1 DUF1232 domain-containing protein [Hymenobacteraceae bacterium]MDX5510641.1 DUF1232 domain-containing protein [Hymenobacteraceae bacterium]